MFIARMGRKIRNDLSSAVTNPDVGWQDNLIVNNSNRICVASLMSLISAALPSPETARNIQNCYSPIEQMVLWLGKANRTVCGQEKFYFEYSACTTRGNRKSYLWMGMDVQVKCYWGKWRENISGGQGQGFGVD